MTIDFAAEASLTRIEEQVRRFWRRYAVPETVRAARRDGPPVVIYQQPLDLAGRPWNDQVRLLATTELYARYHTMRGDSVHVQTGWNGHGLAVERTVEQALGPLPVDWAAFVDACRAWVAQEQAHTQDQLQRMGLWWNDSPAFDTTTPASIGVVWSALKQLWAAGRLARIDRVVPICPRCATPLSEVEATRHTAKLETTAVWVRLPWESEPDTYFLFWTRSPWRLPGMVALAAHPDASYALVETAGSGDEPPMRLVLAEMALGRALTGDYRLVRRLNGKALRGMRYLPPFAILPAAPRTHSVVLDETLPLDQGTGLLAVTPSFDSHSLALAGAHDLSIPDLLDDRGRWAESVLPWQGLLPQETEPLIVENLQSRDLIYRQIPDSRTAASCPYCRAPLLHLARSTWQVETASGPWIVGRDRAWAAPLPVWICERCGEKTCLAGLDDLAHRTNLEPRQIDPHRPAVDRLVFPCGKCDGMMRRVLPVVDAALETAILPWVTAPQPAGSDVQSLAIGLGDQHLGWLGASTEMLALLRDALAWQQAVALPEAPSEPEWEDKPSQPADALLWAAHSGTTPQDAEQSFLRPLWHLLAPATQEAGAKYARLRMQRDQWLAVRLRQAAGDIATALDACEPRRATQILAELKEDLISWQSLQPPGAGPFSVETRENLGRLLAPFVPHLAEVLYRHGKTPGAESVHLAAWPARGLTGSDRQLLAGVARGQRLAALARQARVHAGIAQDRILPQARVGILGDYDDEALDLEPYHDLLLDLLVVARVQVQPEAAAQVEWRLAPKADRSPERRSSTQAVAEALENLATDQAAELASKLQRGMSISLRVGQHTVTLLPDEIHLVAQPPSGWLAAADGQYLVLLRVG